MASQPSEKVKRAWRRYQRLENILSRLWETYDTDFLEHFFPEVTGFPEPPPETPDHHEDDDIPF